MDYTVKALAELTGLTPRTLRYYDAIGLLHPRRDRGNDYRLYGPEEVSRLEDILLYRDMGVPLEEIGRLLDDPGYDRAAALREHLRRLERRQRETENLIRAVKQTIRDMKGETSMKERAAFEGMKAQVIRENEAHYGREAREKYGDETVDDANRRISGMSREEWGQMRREEKDYLAALVRAMEAGDPAGEDAREACRLHMAWLRHTWRPELCTPEAHMGLVSMYAQDDRFRAYYDQNAAPGSADFFAKAIWAYYGD